MLEPDPRALLDALLAADGRVLGDAELCQVEAGREGPITGYAVRWTRGSQEGRDLVYVEPCTRGQAGGVLLVDPQSGRRRLVWRYPDDPALPALPLAVHPDAVAALLPRLGVRSVPVGLELMTYRPRRRAVVHVRPEAGSAVYLKVLRPEHAELVHDKYRTLHAAGLPVPQPLGWAPAGLLALAEVPGVPAAHLLPDVVAAPRFAAELAALLERLRGAVRMDWPPRRTPAVAVGWYAAQLIRARPEQARRIAAVRDAVLASPRAEAVGIHGDLHLGQVLVDPARPGRITGLLDVDTAGPGEPVDDAAALVSHLALTALTAADDRERTAARWAAREWTPHLVRGPLHPRLAGHLLALALEPATRGDDALTDELLAAAERATVPG